MITKGIVFEDFVNYKVPCMTIEMPHCNFKCDRECGKPVCQNGPLAHSPNINYSIDKIIQSYIENPITRAVVFQGLEPFDSIEDLREFIFKFRLLYSINDDVVIYTGYNKDEIEKYVIQLAHFSNIIIKFGRYVPNSESHYDEILGVKLASSNQYAERIS
jgi:hypothetical protein